jgi:hypothetical protein
MTLADVLNTSKVLTDNLAPYDNRTLNLSTQMNVDLVTATSGLFQDQSKLAKNYREGRVASNSLGFSRTSWRTPCCRSTRPALTTARAIISPVALCLVGL